MGIVTTTGLSRAAQKFNAVLQTLPFEVLSAVLSTLGINLLEVQNKDTIIGLERKGGLSGPYAVSTSDTENTAAELGRILERDLEVKDCVLAFKDHIKNYDEKIIITGQTTGDNQDKKHPLERIVLEAMVRTIGEDIIDALFFMVRNTSDNSPMGMADGYHELIGQDISAGNITAGKGNLISTGAIAAPISDTDTDAIDKAVAFIRSLNPFLKKNGLLMMTGAVKTYVMDALENKTKYKSVLSFDQVESYLRDKCDAPGLKIISHYCMGTGDRLIATVPGNFDLGMRTKSDSDFVQVRSPYKDPNWVQFWSQWGLGARIRSVHPKMFAVNDRTNTAVDMAGDYQS